MKSFPLFLFVFLGVHLLLLINLQFTAWPEMLSYPYLRNNGFLIYKDMIHPYPPILTMGLSWAYALFGYHIWVLQAVAWGVILASGVLIFLIAKQITKSDKFALASLGFYVFLQPFLEGNMLWFDLAIIPPILLGLFFLLRNNFLLAGLFLSVAALTKQTAGIFYLFAILYFLFNKFTFRKILPFLLGPFIIGIPLSIRLIQEGALNDFLNWTIIYPVTQWSKFPGYIQMSLAPKELLILFILFLPILPLLPVLKQKILNDKNLQLIALFSVASLIAVYPRFSFFHFQTAIAILVILYGYLLSKIKITRLTIAQCLVPIALLFFLVHRPTFMRDWQKEARFYGEEDKRMAQVIANRVNENERVYLLGLHSGLYAMSDRLPPERWTDNFSWYLEIPGVQDEIISRWSTNPPKVIFWRTPSPGNKFDLGTYQPQKIVRWIEVNYTKVEEVKPGIWLWESSFDSAQD